MYVIDVLGDWGVVYGVEFDVYFFGGCNGLLDFEFKEGKGFEGLY